MDLFKGLDIGGLKSTVESGIKAAQDGISSIDVNNIGKAVEGGVKAAQDGLTNVKVDEIAKSVKDAVAAGASGLAKTLEGLGGKGAEESPAQGFTTRQFIELLWLLARVDGAVSDVERGKIAELAHDFDEYYETYAHDLEHDCMTRVDASAAEFGRENASKVEAQRTLESRTPSKRDAKLLCWNLLAVANADGMTDDEADFVRFASERAGCEASVFDELRNYLVALDETRTALDALCASNRSYGQIEPIANELAQREQVIITAAQTLVSDN